MDPQTPAVAVLPRNELYSKNMWAIGEIRARRGPVYLVRHPGPLQIAANRLMEVPLSKRELDPVPLNNPLQRLAYRVGRARGIEIDQPRNLGKSVSVEQENPCARGAGQRYNHERVALTRTSRHRRQDASERVLT